MDKALENLQPRSATRPAPAPRASRGPGPVRRYLAARNPVGRGLLLFVALVVFTFAYAFILQWLSQSSDTTAEPPEAALRQPVVARQAPVVAGPVAPAAPAVHAHAVPVPAAPAHARPLAAHRAASEPAAVAYLAVDDSVPAANGERFTYLGQWDHASNIHDGRSLGTSSRSYHIGATAAFQFTGTHLRLYGIRGPNGGYAEMRIDGQTYGLLRFYAPRKEPGVLIYASPALAAGTHDVDVIVAQAPDGLPKRRFVNIDGAAYAGR